MLFEAGEALRKAFGLKVAEERKHPGEIERQIARVNAAKDGGTDEDRRLFKEAEDAHQRATSAYPACAATGPHCWRGHLGDAELHLSRAKTLQDEALSLIAADGAPPASAAPAPKSPKNARATSPAPPTAEAESAKDVDLSTAPIDLKLLNVFIKRIQKGGPAMTDRAHAVSLCLTAAVQSLHEAVRHFDKAIGLNPDLMEAYRDRGLGYYRLAQCEAILAAVQDPDGKSTPQNLDRALVDGRKDFEKRSCTWSM